MNNRSNSKLLRALINKCRKMEKKIEISISTLCNNGCCWYSFKKSTKHERMPEISLGGGDGVPSDVPKGYMVVYVGENMRRFVIKIGLLKQPLFVDLLDLARDKYGDSPTPSRLWIPCEEAMFLDVVRCVSSPMKVRRRSCPSWRMITDLLCL